MSDQLKLKFYSWVEWGTRAIIVAAAGLVWQTYTLLQDLARTQGVQANVQAQLMDRAAKTDAVIDAMRREYVTRIELASAIDRVKQQVTINQLQSQIDRGHK